MNDFDWQPLIAAVVIKALADVCQARPRRPEMELDALMWLTGRDFPIFAELLNIPDDGLLLFRSGAARKVAHAAKEKFNAQYKIEQQAARRRVQPV